MFNNILQNLFFDISMCDVFCYHHNTIIAVCKSITKNVRLNFPG